MRYRSYKIITSTLSPLIGWWLRVRLARGKESKARFNERFGFAKTPRPKGLVLWIDAASFGAHNKARLRRWLDDRGKVERLAAGDEKRGAHDVRLLPRI